MWITRKRDFDSHLDRQFHDCFICINQVYFKFLMFSLEALGKNLNSITEFECCSQLFFLISYFSFAEDKNQKKNSEEVVTVIEAPRQSDLMVELIKKVKTRGSNHWYGSI